MTRTSQALRRLGVSGLAVATVVLGSPLLASTAAHAAGTPKLVADDCTVQSTGTTTTTTASTGTGTGCTTQAQVNTVRTLTFTYTEGGSPVAGRTVDFTITQPAASAGNPNAFSASFPATQPSGTTSFAGPAPANQPGQGAQCTTDASGKCRVNITDSEAESVTVTATERASGATASETVEFRQNSVAAYRLDETSRTVVAPEGNNATKATPGRPVELTYTVTDRNGASSPASTQPCNNPAVTPNNGSTCTGNAVKNQLITLNLDNAAYFTPNCTPRDASGTNSPQRATAGTPAVPPSTPASPSTGQLAPPEYRACSFTGTPTDDALVTPLVNQGQTLTVRTDENGQFTVTVAEGRDAGFDAAGVVNVQLTAVEQGASTTLTPRTPGNANAATAGACTPAPAPNSTTGQVTTGAGCNASTIDFTTKSKALNGTTIAIVPVDGTTLSASPTVNNVPDVQTRVFVIQLRDQYGNLTNADGTSNNKATIQKTGVGTLYKCGIGTSTSTNPCGSQSTTGGSPAVQNNGTTTQTYSVRGSFLNRDEQERFLSSAESYPGFGTAAEDGTQTLTAKWVAPVTEYMFSTPVPPATTGTLAAGGFDQTETDNVATSIVSINYYKQVPTDITFKTTPSSSVPINTVVTVSATVKDQFGQPVQGLNVAFFRSGTSNNCTNSANNGTGTSSTAVTGPNGTAGFSFTCSDASTQNITIIVTDANGNELGRGTQVVKFNGPVPTSSPSATPTATSSPSATPTATSSPSASTPPASRQTLVLTVVTPTVPAGSNARIDVTGSANQAIQLLCYTRPSTTFAVVRQTTIDAAGDTVSFSNLAIGRNTRCFAQYSTNSSVGQSNSGVINARTVISLSAVRISVRQYVFQGRNLPRFAGQLITLYRVDRAGNEIRTAIVKTDDTGVYRIPRTFTGTGTFQFKVRTSTTLNNVAGVSNVITVVVH